MIKENCATNALEALKKGDLLFNEQCNLDKAASSYQEAIDLLANREIEIFIAAKQRLATIKKLQGKAEEADKLSEESIAAIEALGIEDINVRGCDECTWNGIRGEWRGTDPHRFCKPCPPNI